jgi:hypothetical protein
LSPTTWIGKKGLQLWRSSTPKECPFAWKTFEDRRTGDERDNGRELKAIPREEMTQADEYKRDVLEIDSLMCIPVDWGGNELQNNK